MASYSTDDQFFSDVARFLELLNGVRRKVPPVDGQGGELVAELLQAAIEMTNNGVFTLRRKQLTYKLALLSMEDPEVLKADKLSNFLQTENARNKGKKTT